MFKRDSTHLPSYRLGEAPSAQTVLIARVNGAISVEVLGSKRILIGAHVSLVAPIFLLFDDSNRNP